MGMAEISSSRNDNNNNQHETKVSIILFYKYHALSDDPAVTEEYRSALQDLCQSLDLTGRILVAHSSRSEGINGTLAGRHDQVRIFTLALIGKATRRNEEDKDNGHDAILQRFWIREQRFFSSIGVAPLRLQEEEFKWSSLSSSSCHNSSSNNDFLFPDLNVRLVKELISSGGVLSPISIDETAQGYLTPQEWHAELSKLNNTAKTTCTTSTTSDTILIDCRNTKEYEIGHFQGALDPVTTTFCQFPRWVQENKHLLADKKVLVYCTGGIRCEKASAFIRRQGKDVGIKSVHHLQGGIHKYLETYGSADGGLWKGKNYVFDGRGAATAEETRLGRFQNNNNQSSSSSRNGKEEGETNSATASSERSATTTRTASSSSSSSCNTSHQQEEEEVVVVGKCVACAQPYDSFDPDCVCTVCREKTLVCLECQGHLVEYHCRQHSHLQRCYFSNLERFSPQELMQQLDNLEPIYENMAIGRGFKQKRKTILKQCEKIQARLEELWQEQQQGSASGKELPQQQCLNCAENECSGRCWGFYKRKELLDRRKPNDDSDKNGVVSARSDTLEAPGVEYNKAKQQQQQQLSKKAKRDYLIAEIDCLKLSLPPSAHRDSNSGVRIPPIVTRQLRCTTKAKWCGRPVIAVLQEEFADLSRPDVMQQVLERGLLRVNDRPVESKSAFHVLLKSSDVISRIVHWHEAPVIVPDRIQVHKVAVPSSVATEYGVKEGALIYVCNKPSSVPVHPAGPYVANTLTLMVEAQENVDTLSLTPLHRTDRVTSGLTLCCSDPKLSHVFHKCSSEGQVRKLYLAKVYGKFIECANDLAGRQQLRDIGTCVWRDDSDALEVNIPVETVDPRSGIRAATDEGKPSKSLFRLVKFNPSENTSLVACFPVTGRNHQLRVHLEWLGFPVVGDVQYSGQVLYEPTGSDVAQATVKLMKGFMNESTDQLRLPGISERDVEAAKNACQCCSSGEEDGSGIVNSFTSAQLLQGGHAICLHALRYEISILPKKKRASSPTDPLAVLNFSVDPPTWANSMLSSDIPWIKPGSPSERITRPGIVRTEEIRQRPKMAFEASCPDHC